MPPKRISPEDSLKIAEKVKRGESPTRIAEYFSCAVKTVYTHAAKHGCKPPERYGLQPRQSMMEFKKRVRSTLWRVDGRNKEQFNKWEAKVKYLVTNANYTELQAVVQAAKDFSCLNRLFREYDVARYDPNPESHSHTEANRAKGSSISIHIEERDCTFREQLRWAMDAAGKKQLSGEDPTTCPNHSAFYLYQQALDDTKDFIAKMASAEAKGDSAADQRAASRVGAQKSIAEIDKMLGAMDE